jgi:hypothetical protein
MVIRTYFDKNNTLIKDNLTNTARNPITELYYGGNIDGLQYTRYIFHFDETRLRELYSGGTFPDIAKMTHTLKMTNTGLFDSDLLNNTASNGLSRTCSFDLILFSIDTQWDEGTGYDYRQPVFFTGSTDFAAVPSNWATPQTLMSWNGGSGVYSGSPSGITVTTQHFDLGNENLEMDITNAVNAIITGNTNYGFGIAFDRMYEESASDNLNYVGFFTRFTQTFYEPYIETTYSERIKDDRGKFYLDKPNKLYLYVNLGNMPTNLDVIPSVIVYNQNGTQFSAYTSANVTHVTLGVYSIDILVPTTNNYADCVGFTDVWSDIVINGVSRPNVELDFVLTDAGKYYNISNNDTMPQNYGFSVHGIKMEEKIVRGDIRKVLVSTRIPFTVNQTSIIDNLQYRLYVKEGRGEVTVIDYEDVERAFNNNYFLLDTASLIPNTYYLDVKVESNYQVTTIKDAVNFDIVSQVEFK